MLDEALAAVASRQYGLFSRLQVLEVGGNDRIIHVRLASGRWLREAEGVYGLPGWPKSWWRRVWRAYLASGPGAVVSHDTAAAIHGLANYPRGRLVLTTAHGNHHWHGLAEMRQSTDLRPEHVTSLNGLPLTTVARTLFDLSAVSGAERLAIAVEDAHITKTCRLEELLALYEQLRPPGKHGMRKLGRVLATRGPGYVPPQSWLERRLVRILLEGGLPRPRLQAEFPWRQDLESRCDAVYDDARMLLEADGRRWHARVDQMANDRRRD
ncbi:MAG TPA: hypothetical protein VNY84_08890, partial [Acidimicrobiales bacterium]|nr:hypothetical protein [Acidimicrobiales bacterium]